MIAVCPPLPDTGADTVEDAPGTLTVSQTVTVSSPECEGQPTPVFFGQNSINSNDHDLISCSVYTVRSYSGK